MGDHSMKITYPENGDFVTITDTRGYKVELTREEAESLRDGLWVTMGAPDAVERRVEELERSLATVETELERQREYEQVERKRADEAEREVEELRERCEVLRRLADEAAADKGLYARRMGEAQQARSAAVAKLAAVREILYKWSRDGEWAGCGHAHADILATLDAPVEYTRVTLPECSTGGHPIAAMNELKEALADGAAKVGAGYGDTILLVKVPK
jgi:hypothetical protein